MTRAVSRSRVGVVAAIAIAALAAITIASRPRSSEQASAGTGSQEPGEVAPSADPSAPAPRGADVLAPVLAAEERSDAGAVNTAEALTIRFSHVTAPETIKHRCALLFKQRVEALSAGRIRVDISPNGRSFHDGEELQALLAGFEDMLAVSLPQLAHLKKNDFELFGLPYLFESEADFRTIVDGPIGAELMQQLQRSGMEGLAYWSNGFQGVGATKPLHAPADFVGLRVRVQRSATLTESFRVLGGAPFVTTFADQILTLERGAADAAENSLANFVSQRLDRFQPFFTTLRHVVLAYGVIVAKGWWEKLSGEERELVERAMKDATLESQHLAMSSDDEARRALAKRGKTRVVDLTDEERTTLRAALRSSYEHATPSVQALSKRVELALGRVH